MTIYELKISPFVIESPNGFILHNEEIAKEVKKNVKLIDKNAFSVASEASTPHLIFALPEYEGVKNPGFPLLSFYQLYQPLLGLNDLLKQYEQSSLHTTTPLETTIGNLKAFYLSTKFHQTPPPENGYSSADTFFRIEYIFDYQGKVYICELITSEHSKDRYNPVFEKFCHSIRLK